MTLALQDLLNSSTEFRAILGKAQGLNLLQRQLTTLLPAHLAPYFQVTGMQFGTLTLAAGNATVAARIRQNAPDLIDKFSKMGVEVNEIRIRVQVSYPPPPRKHQPRQLGSNAVREIEQLRNRLPDSPLKSALQRLTGKKT